MMSGSFEAVERDASSYEITVIVPGTIAYPHRDAVRIEAQSETSAMLMRRVVEDANLRTWPESGQNAEVAIVLLEVPLRQERDIVRDFRDLHPGVWIIAVGSPTDEKLFDRVCASAMDHRALTEALNGIAKTMPKGSSASVQN